ncbi:MAG: hypothetical protein P9L96_02520 [Candidatus Gygaella obscura]|nr:hypothetical protein [Candidatus Gygaella obscura]
MWKILRGKKGQNTAEYAILFAIIVGAVMAMQTYVKRGLQKGVQHRVDEGLNEELSVKSYEPYYLRSNYTSTTDYTEASSDYERIGKSGDVARTYGLKSTTREGTQIIKDTDVIPVTE